MTLGIRFDGASLILLDGIAKQSQVNFLQLYQQVCGDIDPGSRNAFCTKIQYVCSSSLCDPPQIFKNSSAQSLKHHRNLQPVIGYLTPKLPLE
jgi:hypothetical protein